MNVQMWEERFFEEIAERAENDRVAHKGGQPKVKGKNKTKHQHDKEKHVERLGAILAEMEEK